MTDSQPAPKVVEKPDQLTPTKSLYDASGAEVFWKNFLAGFSRALGGVFLYSIFLYISFALFLEFAYPKIKPLIESYTNALNSINNLKSQPTKPQDLQKLLQQFQTGN